MPLPQQWRQVKLGDLAELVRGVSFDATEVSTDPTPEAVPILRAGNIQDELEMASDLVWVPAAKVSEEQLLRVGDVAICMSSGSSDVVGKTAPLREAWRGSVGAFCGIIRPKPVVDAAYLACSLRSPWFTQWRRNRAMGANIQNLRRTDLALVLLPLPPLSEQQRIVAMLQEAESVRRLRAQADQLTNEIIPALFVSIFGESERNPHHWPVRRLGTLLRGTPQNGLYKPSEAYGEGTPIIRIGDFYDGRFVDAARLQRLRVSDAERANYGVNNGEVLVNRVNSMEHLGKSVLVAGLTEPTVFESNMMRLVPDTSQMIPEYLIEFLQTPAALLRLRGRAKEAVNQASINQGDILSLQVPLPPLALQENFRIAWEELRIARSTNGDADGKATELFSSLLSHAFSGELTAKWRERHTAELAREAAERDAALAALAPMRTRRALGPAAVMAEELPTASALPHLTQRQRELWAVVREHVSKDARLFTPETLLESAPAEAEFTRDEIRRHLDVLTAVGLVIAHTRADEAEAGTGYYLVWRLPEPLEKAEAEPDFLRSSELSRLAEKLKKELHK